MLEYAAPEGYKGGTTEAQMKFRAKNDQGELVDLPVNVRKAPDYKEIYAHGAMGGWFFNYHFRIDFYRDQFPPIDDVIMRGNEYSSESVKQVDRSIQASIYLSPSFAKELRNWLDKNITKLEAEYGEIALPKGDEDEAEEAAPKIKKEA
jgi:hypothetical protein